MFTQEQLKAIDQTVKKMGKIRKELDDKTGEGGVKCDLLDFVSLRLWSLQKLCKDVILIEETLNFNQGESNGK
jgi:hypothetical protein